MTHEFLNYLEMDAETKRIRELDWGDSPIGRDYRVFKHIVFDSLSLSIQGSVHHHCSPRETFENPSIYSSMEVAFFNTKTREWLDIFKDERFDNFLNLEDFRDNEEVPGLFSYVPVDMIEDVFQYLKGTSAVEPTVGLETLPGWEFYG